MLNSQHHLRLGMLRKQTIFLFRLLKRSHLVSSFFKHSAPTSFILSAYYVPGVLKALGLKAYPRDLCSLEGECCSEENMLSFVEKAVPASVETDHGTADAGLAAACHAQRSREMVFY